MAAFEINGLDHVAIRVADMPTSIQWYQRVLGLKKYQLEKWGEYPIFMLADKVGVALFPAIMTDPELLQSSKNIKIDHFAFNVSKQDFKKAKAHFEELQVAYTFSDHHYYHSLYLNDPDGHVVELTSLMVKEEDFY